MCVSPCLTNEPLQGRSCASQVFAPLAPHTSSPSQTNGDITGLAGPLSHRRPMGSSHWALTNSDQRRVKDPPRGNEMTRAAMSLETCSECAGRLRFTLQNPVPGRGLHETNTRKGHFKGLATKQKVTGPGVCHRDMARPWKPRSKRHKDMKLAMTFVSFAL